MGEVIGLGGILNQRRVIRLTVEMIVVDLLREGTPTPFSPELLRAIKETALERLLTHPLFTDTAA